MLLLTADVGQLHVAAAARAAFGALAEHPDALDLRSVGRRAHRTAAHVTPDERSAATRCTPPISLNIQLQQEAQLSLG